MGMREIAREVGIEAPSIYNHYKGKDEILAEICFDTASQFFKSFEAVVDKEDKPLKQLKAAVVAHVGVINENMEAAEVFFNEWMFIEEPEKARFKKMRYDYEMRFREIMDKGIKRGDFKKVDTKLACFVIFSALNATIELSKSNSRINKEEMAEEMANILLKGIKA